MLQRPTAIFLVNLIQDVSILRPLMIMARRDFGFAVRMLVSSKFRSRDQSGTWEAELEIIRLEVDAEVVFYRSDWDAVRHLHGSGIIFSGSESSVPEHSAAHAVFRYAPPAFLKVTVQHGFECVGFRHNAAHDQAYANGVSFSADVVCTWQPPQLEPALAPSQRGKVEVTGPTSALQTFGPHSEVDGGRPGMVCENLHSVRLKSTANLGEEFLSTFGEFCRLIGEQGGEVVLRPHPGGQYVVKNNVELPPNARINNAPMFRLDLRRYAFGISAPSSVLIDFLCADVPTAIWADAAGAIDTRNYSGIAKVSGAAEWLEFAREAAANPAPFVKVQRQFLADQRMPIEPADVFSRYASIFQAAERLSVTRGKVSLAGRRLLVVANGHLPTVQVCLEAPLERLVVSGEVVIELLTETRLKQVGDTLGADHVPGWIERALDLFGPDFIIFSRYSGPFLPIIVDWARSRSVPIVYHIDDDLLAVPLSLGERKHQYHNAPERLSSVRSGLLGADIVYASTDRLRARLLGYFPELPAVAGRINASGRVRRAARAGAARTIGYVASADHLPNLQMVIGPIAELLDEHPELAFELFGSIPVPDELTRFEDRVRRVPPIANYEKFLQALCAREWDIGICPLTPTDFNRAKSNNKWVEYTSAGIAVIASADTVYDECCSDGCGFLCGSLDEWRLALERLVTDSSERVTMVERAQRRLETDYGISAHREQILDILRLAKERTVEEPIKEHA